MAGETIKLRQTIDMLHVPFKGSDDLVARVCSAARSTCSSTASASPLVKSGKARAIAVFADQRHPDLPDVPTLAEVSDVKTALPSVWWGHVRAQGHAGSRS